jgi:hypothetical protein
MNKRPVESNAIPSIIRRLNLPVRNEDQAFGMVQLRRRHLPSKTLATWFSDRTVLYGAVFMAALVCGGAPPVAKLG